MKINQKHLALFLPLCLFLAFSCKPKIDDGPQNQFQTTPYNYSADLPPNFPKVIEPADNQATVQGVKLGRMLFYDPILSGDSTQSCQSCHKQENAFATNEAFETGIHGTIGRRSGMPLFNLAFQTEGFFWDGRAVTLEDQATHPVEDPLEMASTWPESIKRLQRHPLYPSLFKEAFGSDKITKENTAKALAQFIRTLISSRSKFDEFSKTGDLSILTPSERRGFEKFTRDPVWDNFGTMLTSGSDCFHCHSPARDFRDFTSFGTFRNNGLDSVVSLKDFKDRGRGEVTLDTMDNGKFKVPSLRNLVYTAPYMHDSRFETLDEVIDHYNAGGKPSRNLDNFMGRKQFANNGGHLGLNEQDKKDLINFLKTLTDTAFVKDPRFSSPF